MIKDLYKAAELMKREELHVAADWWCRTLMSDILSDSGDAINDAFIAALKGKRHPWDIPNQRHIDSFRLALVSLMATHFSEGWDDANPNWGSAHRVIAVDYHPNHILRCALDFSSVPGVIHLPVKTTMWVKPFSVEIGVGYRSAVEEIFKK